ncbi:MAG: hypothetical protein F4Z31_17670 [Gemmatimonadetes bacterium]|nr:hypothetical protein [Gemmatimonadota bacterium]
MRERRGRALPAALILAVACGGCGEGDGGDANPAAGAPPGVPAIQPGSGQFTFHDARGNADRPMTVRYQRTASDSYLFVTESLTDFVDPVPAV